MDYEPYLKEIGAADERDDIFAASCYCPIHNLENSDTAYEWLFCGENEFRRMKMRHTPEGIKREIEVGAMSDKQVSLSKEEMFQFLKLINIYIFLRMLYLFL